MMGGFQLLVNKGLITAVYRIVYCMYLYVCPPMTHQTMGTKVS